MSNRFYINPSLINSQNLTAITINGDLYHYIKNVRRYVVGENIVLFCGDNSEYLAEIIEINKRDLKVKLFEQQKISRETSINLHLYISLLPNDKMDLLIQKAVELGVTQITPMICQYSHRYGGNTKSALNKKINHWQAVAISACEQCGRNLIPPINPPLLFKEMTNLANIKNPDNNNIFADFNGIAISNKISELKTSGIVQKTINLFVGGAGGFAQEEIGQMRELNFCAINLGKRVLRAETAALLIIAKLIDN